VKKGREWREGACSRWRWYRVGAALSARREEKGRKTKGVRDERRGTEKARSDRDGARLALDVVEDLAEEELAPGVALGPLGNWRQRERRAVSAGEAVLRDWGQSKRNARHSPLQTTRTRMRSW
jgi:hypothetical protein